MNSIKCILCGTTQSGPGPGFWIGKQQVMNKFSKTIVIVQAWSKVNRRQMFYVGSITEKCLLPHTKSTFGLKNISGDVFKNFNGHEDKYRLICCGGVLSLAGHKCDVVDPTVPNSLPVPVDPNLKPQFLENLVNDIVEDLQCFVSLSPQIPPQHEQCKCAKKSSCSETTAVNNSHVSAKKPRMSFFEDGVDKLLDL